MAGKRGSMLRGLGASWKGWRKRIVSQIARNRAAKRARLRNRRAKWEKIKNVRLNRLKKTWRKPARSLSPNSPLTTNFPETFSFDLDLDGALRFLHDLEHVLIVSPSSDIVIDPSRMKRLTAEAALVLIAALDRASDKRAMPQKRWRIFGETAVDAEVHHLLGEIGYYNHLPGVDWIRDGRRKQLIVPHISGAKIKPLRAKQFSLACSSAAGLKPEETKTLYNAIIECMANVHQHAYPSDIAEPVMPRQWWMAGSRDPDTRQISLSIFDQGIGIAKTIRTRWRDQLSIFSASDEDLIVKAVIEGYSSTQQLTRGKGLPTLKSFIDQHGKGRLMIVTRSSTCIFEAGQEPTVLRNSVPLRGTLISWKLQTDVR